MMTIRTFRSNSFREALDAVREEIGPDALILNSRQERRRRFPWFRLKEQTILTVGIRVESDSQTPHPELTEFHCSPGAAQPPACGEGDTLFRLFTELIEQDIPESHARTLLACVSDKATEAKEFETSLNQVAGHLAESIPCCGPIKVSENQQRVVALIGPTGVGKTTTIAKLAAHYRLEQNRRVGLITVDTYRVGGVEQLQSYADLLDVPMSVATSSGDVRNHLDKLADCELVLVDTAGRSPFDEMKIQELRACLQAACADEVHLVLSMASGHRTLTAMIDRFRRVRPTALLMTKLDETPCLGVLLTAITQSRLPVSYLTTGQNVPDDIEIARRERVTRLILGMETLRDSPHITNDVVNGTDNGREIFSAPVRQSQTGKDF